jgi:hypothetical protein
MKPSPTYLAACALLALATTTMACGVGFDPQPPGLETKLGFVHDSTLSAADESSVKAARAKLDADVTGSEELRDFVVTSGVEGAAKGTRVRTAQGAEGLIVVRNWEAPDGASTKQSRLVYVAPPGAPAFTYAERTDHNGTRTTLWTLDGGKLTQAAVGTLADAPLASRTVVTSGLIAPQEELIKGSVALLANACDMCTVAVDTVKAMGCAAGAGAITVAIGIPSVGLGLAVAGAIAQLCNIGMAHIAAIDTPLLCNGLARRVSSGAEWCENVPSACRVANFTSNEPCTQCVATAKCIAKVACKQDVKLVCELAVPKLVSASGMCSALARGTCSIAETELRERCVDAGYCATGQ